MLIVSNICNMKYSSTPVNLQWIVPFFYCKAVYFQATFVFINIIFV